MNMPQKLEQDNLMTNEEIQKIRELCGQPRLSQTKIEQLNETRVDESDIKEMADFYRNMGIPVTRAKLIELVEKKKAKCACCGDVDCDKCDCDAESEDEECTDCEKVDVCDGCKKEVADCECE